MDHYLKKIGIFFSSYQEVLSPIQIIGVFLDLEILKCFFLLYVLSQKN